MAIPKGRPRNPNGVLRFQNDYNNKQGTKYLWVYEVDWQIGMSGKKAQSRWTQRFYPQSFTQEPLNIKGRCASMSDQQRLATFIRNNQLLLIQHAGERFKHNSPFLMSFSLPSEDIYVKGYVETFEIHKQGHFAPAPEYTIPFNVIFDRRHSNFDPRISFTLKSLQDAIIEGTDPDLIPDFSEIGDPYPLPPRATTPPQDGFPGAPGIDIPGAPGIRP